MKTQAFVIAALFASVNSINLSRHHHHHRQNNLVQWPSVARCDGNISTDGNPCDNLNREPHRHDDTTLQISADEASNIVKSWPSVARCDHQSHDNNQCDHNNQQVHDHDGVIDAAPVMPNPLPPYVAPAAAPAAAVALQLDEGWPSVARCDGNISTDGNPCDNLNREPHRHDDTTIQIGEQWPSVARCDGSYQSHDNHQCDHNNKMVHDHDGVIDYDSVAAMPNPLPAAAPAAPPAPVALLQFRPQIKCKDPGYGNPISCDPDDIVGDALGDALAAPKKYTEKSPGGLTPVTEIEGGPLVNNMPDPGPSPEELAAASKDAKDKAKEEKGEKKPIVKEVVDVKEPEKSDAAKKGEAADKELAQADPPAKEGEVASKEEKAADADKEVKKEAKKVKAKEDADKEAEKVQEEKEKVVAPSPADADPELAKGEKPAGKEKAPPKEGEKAPKAEAELNKKKAPEAVAKEAEAKGEAPPKEKLNKDGTTPTAEPIPEA